MRIASALVVTAVAWASAGCSAAFTSEAEGSKTFAATAPVAAVDVATFNGRVEISTGEPGRVDVTFTRRGTGSSKEQADRHLANVSVEVAQDGDRVVVAARRAAPDESPGSSGATLRVVVPPGLALSAKTNDGSVTVHGPATGVVVRSSNGAIRVDGATGAVDLETTNGSVHLQGTALVASMQSSNGSLTLSGSLAAGRTDLATTNGSVEVTLPADTRANLVAHTSNGSVTCEFALEGGAQERTSVEGELGGGGRKPTDLVIRTSNGAVRIRKAP
jgi:DUF4097 and DUF4098 domain-containing protein YvlB